MFPGVHHNDNSHLSSLRVLDAGESQVADAPAGVDAVNLQLRELKGRIEGFGADPNDDGVDGQRHALHNLLGKTVLAEERKEKSISEVRKKNQQHSPRLKLTEQILVKSGGTHFCPDAVAMGEGPLGGRGSSQVLISISTLSRVCVEVITDTLARFFHFFIMFIGDHRCRRPVLVSTFCNYTSIQVKRLELVFFFISSHFVHS